jgi:hypothetical protein
MINEREKCDLSVLYHAVISAEVWSKQQDAQQTSLLPIGFLILTHLLSLHEVDFFHLAILSMKLVFADVN